MKKTTSVVLKLVFIGVIVLILCLANLLIGGQMKNRENIYVDSQYEISHSAGGYFSLYSAYIAVPYDYTYTATENNQVHVKNGKGIKVFNAKHINYSADLNSEIRHLGIYQTPIFTGELKIDAVIEVQKLEDADKCKYYFEKSFLIIPISSTSLMERSTFKINGDDYETFYHSYSEGIQNDKDGIACNLNITKSGIYNFSTTLKIRGAKTFRILLDSSETKLKIKSDWVSPGFTEFTYLPDTREITNKGFTAEWNIPFASENERNDIGFNFIEPVNLYKKLNRAYNYAFIFIIVPFVILFLFELLANVNLHPIHYLLCGAASVIFFLLLLSISEHLNFTLAYLIGAFASGILVSLYVISITKKIKLGGLMSLMFILLYSYLFFCLKSEDYALLMGSIFAFILLATVMFLSRKINWSNLKKNTHTDLIEE